MIGVALGTGVNIYLNQKEHDQRAIRMMNLYGDEVAAYIGKDRADVGLEDLYAVGEKLPTLGDALKRNDGVRNLKNIAWGITALVTWAATAVTILAFGISSGWLLWGVIGGIGILGFRAVDTALQKAGARMMKLHEPTAHDKIRALSKTIGRDRAISQEEVLDVYLTARPELALQVKEHYGKPFGKLDDQKKYDVILGLGRQLEVEQMAMDINSGLVDVAELAFGAHGTRSGLVVETGKGTSPVTRVQERVREKAGDIAAASKRRLEAGKETFQAGRKRFNAAREAVAREGIRGLITEFAEERNDTPDSWQAKETARRAERNIQERSVT